MKYRCAGGAEIANEGEVTVKAVDANGTPMPTIVFQHAKIGMPILSVRKLAKKGAKVEFEHGGGTIKLPNGDTIPFVQRHGVYFVRLFVQDPNNPDMPGFIRPGN